MKNYTLAIINDDADDRRFFTDAFCRASANITVQTFHSVPVFLDHINNADETPDMILSDIKLLSYSGCEVIKRLRKDLRYSLTPLFMLIIDFNLDEQDDLELDKTMLFLKPVSVDGYREIAEDYGSGSVIIFRFPAYQDISIFEIKSFSNV